MESTRHQRVPTPGDDHRPRTWAREDIATAKKLLREGKTYEEVARVLGKTQGAVFGANQRHWRINWRNWKPEEERQAQQMLRQKLSYEEVAAVLGRSPKAVERKNQSAWRISYKRRHQVRRTCRTCEKPFARKRSLTSEPGRGQFCCNHCYHAYTGETNIERVVREELQRRGISFIQEYPVDRWRLDFFLPTLRAFIECDGLFWHSLPGRPECDAAKDEYLTSAGFVVHRFTEDEIYDDVARCIDSIPGACDEPVPASQVG